MGALGQAWRKEGHGPLRRPGLRFEVVDSGPTDAPAVLLLHGFPQQPSSFEVVASRLNATGLRTLTPSQRGYTPAARPIRRRDYRTAATTADVVALLDTAGLARAHIVVMTGRQPGLGGGRLVPRPGRLADGAVDAAPSGIR